ncbi:GIY-YIG nuclease family protein [Streptomyces sp. NPDC102405]|uniref:GIY-YIG nuclease family protein n=1 Tax=Streptomyces sp. NPDC102405 TaxID=3366170 RepID=UPI00380C769D
MPESQEAEVVYVLGTPGSNVVKIGRTTNIDQRLAAIQRMSPVPLAILWTHPGGSTLEANLHRHFKALRSHGEWFTFGRDPVSIIQWAVDDRPWLRPKVALARPPRGTVVLPHDWFYQFGFPG